jgi:hypothetical protein
MLTGESYCDAPRVGTPLFAADSTPISRSNGGVLTKMEWFNPHGWIYLDVTEPDGKVVNWAIEAGRRPLMRRGPQDRLSRGPQVRRRLPLQSAPRANGKTLTFMTAAISSWEHRTIR